MLNLKSPGGEIGKREGLKIPCRYTACQFDSGPGHKAIKPKWGRENTLVSRGGNPLRTVGS